VPEGRPGLAQYGLPGHGSVPTTRGQRCGRLWSGCYCGSYSCCCPIRRRLITSEPLFYELHARRGPGARSARRRYSGPASSRPRARRSSPSRRGLNGRTGGALCETLVPGCQSRPRYSRPYAMAALAGSTRKPSTGWAGPGRRPAWCSAAAGGYGRLVRGPDHRRHAPSRASTWSDVRTGPGSGSSSSAPWRLWSNSTCSGVAALHR
jgi:hypothetical protein